MDDLVFFASDKNELFEAELAVREYCKNKLKLEIKENNGPVSYKQGICYLGFRIFRSHMRLKPANIKRFYRHLKGNLIKYNSGIISNETVLNSIQSWMVFASFGDTYYLRKKIFDQIELRGFSIAFPPENLNLLSHAG